jgi:hypothetical protein
VVRELGDDSTALWLAMTGIAVGVVSGIILGLLAGFAGGSAGPGRLTTVGPDALSVGLWVALEVSVGAVAGFLTTQQSRTDPASSR